MDAPSIKMEVERVMNLISGFGWEKKKEEVIGDEIHVEIVKKTEAAELVGPGPGPS